MNFNRQFAYRAGPITRPRQLLGLERLQSVQMGSCGFAANYFNQAWQYNTLNQLTEIDTKRADERVSGREPHAGGGECVLCALSFQRDSE